MFKKFLSIENHYRFTGDRYVILEKIDGSNIQFIFNNENIEVASRNQITPNFNNCNDIICKEEYKILFDKLKEISKTKTINLYGEIFSNNIQKNIKYGCLQIRFFSIMIDEQYCCFKTFQEIINNDNLIAPIFGYANSLEEALNFEVENRKSLLCDDNIEGVVIQPFFYFDEKRIYKKKSEKFKEVWKTPKEKNECVELISEEIQDLNNKFQGYLNSNRLKSLLSKGYTKETKNLFILFLDDAFEDFKKDFDLKNIKQKEIKKIKNFDYKEFCKILINI